MCRSTIPKEYEMYLQKDEWVFKTKKDSEEKIKRFKAKLVAKGFKQKLGLDFSETFSLVSSKDSLRIILAL